MEGAKEEEVAMEGVVRTDLRLVVLTRAGVSEERDSEKEGEVRSREVVDGLAGLGGWVVGRRWSSRE